MQRASDSSAWLFAVNLRATCAGCNLGFGWLQILVEFNVKRHDSVLHRCAQGNCFVLLQVLGGKMFCRTGVRGCKLTTFRFRNIFGTNSRMGVGFVFFVGDIRSLGDVPYRSNKIKTYRRAIGSFFSPRLLFCIHVFEGLMEQ